MGLALRHTNIGSDPKQKIRTGQSSSANKSALPNFTIIYWNLSHSELIAKVGDLKLLKISSNTLHYT